MNKLFALFVLVLLLSVPFLLALVSRVTRFHHTFESTQAQQMAEHCANVSEFTYHYSNPVNDYVAILWPVAQCDIQRMQIRRTCIPGTLQSHQAKYFCFSNSSLLL
jgi:hypothetical protein